MKNPIKRKIYRDCRRAMYIPTAAYTVQECLSGLISVLTASILGQFADAVFRLDFSVGMGRLWTLVGCICVTVFALPLLNMFSNIVMLKYSLRHDRMVLAQFLDKEYQSVMRYDAGDVQHRLDWEPTNLRCNYTEIIMDASMAVVTFAYLLYNALRLSAVYTILIFAVSLIKLTVPFAVRKLEQRYDRESREYASKVRTYETEITGQPHIAKLYGLSDALIARLDRAYEEYFGKVEKKKIRCSKIAGGISSVFDTFCTLANLLSGAIMVAGGSVTPGTVAAMVGYFGVFNTIIKNVGNVIRIFPIMQNNADRMMLFYEDEEKLDGCDVGEATEICAAGLSFSYGEREIFHDLSFSIPVDGKTAICGRNGSGKSTILGLLCGLLKGYGGSLKLSGKELSDISLESWRHQIAYAPQDPYLFAGSVRENIRIGRQEASEAEIDDIMEQMELSYLAERTVNAASSELSGGERQKISIARALLKNTPILLLDEPSNNLDAETLAWLRRFLTTTPKSIVYITHDPAFLPIAETVVKV